LFYGRESFMSNLRNALGCVIALIPLRVFYLLSDVFYPIVYYIIGYRKSVVRNNLKNSFPEKTEKELRRIERRFYHSFCNVLTEIIYEAHISKDEIKRRFKFVNIDVILKQFETSQGVMIMTAHYGNWEWGVNFPLFTYEEITSCQIYKKLSNKTFDSFMFRLRAKFGGMNVEKQDLLRTMLRLRSENNKGLFWMISDQTPSLHKIHYRTRLLHQDTPVFTGTEHLARKFNYPVFYAEVKQLKRGCYECEFIPISLHPTQTEEFEITEKYTRLLQQTIEKHPEYWLWSHRRWKYSRN